MQTDLPRGEAHTDLPVQNEAMAANRKQFVLGLLAVLLAGHLYCVVANVEYWPFSRYPMYSAVHQSKWTDEFLVGTLRDDPSEEVRISYLAFARPISVKVSLARLIGALKADPDKAGNLREALVELGQIYTSKKGGLKPADYQEIGTLRLVRISWEVIPGEDHTNAKEIGREVVMEVELPVAPRQASSDGRACK